MALIFLPDRGEFFLWGEERPVPSLAAVTDRAAEAQALVVTPAKKMRVTGMALPLLETVARLAIIPATEVVALPGSVAIWTLASRVALDLVSRERVVPTLVHGPARTSARWAAALANPEDAQRIAALARSMPPAAHAVPIASSRTREVWTPEALLRAFLDATADALVRAASLSPGSSPASFTGDNSRTVRMKARTAPPASATPRTGPRRRNGAGGAAETARPRGRPPGTSQHRRTGEAPSWPQRWHTALTTGDDAFAAQGFGERTLLDDLGRWIEPARGAHDRLRACFRLELPAGDREPFTLRFLLQSPDDPSLLVTATEVWNSKGRSLAKLGRAFRDPQESLLSALGRAARLLPILSGSLAQAKPEQVPLTPAAAWQFLSEGAPMLADAGFGVIVPAELTAAGQRRLRLRMRVNGATSKTAGVVAGTAGLNLDTVLAFEWQAAIGDQPLTAQELKALAKHKAPLVQHRGQWIAIDPHELAGIEQRLQQKSGRIHARDAIRAALAGQARHEGMPVAVTAAGTLAELLTRLRQGADQPVAPPAGFRGTLRPYQGRGLAWLQTMGALGLGACLADDMGLGKTIQILAFLLARMRQETKDRRPALLVAPTSVLGNWEREAQRFAPDLRIVPHYGAQRARQPEDFPQQPGAVVLTSYGLLRRDAALLSSLPWSTVVLDEAQNIKNTASATAKAARALNATHRFALTGTPVENRLAELWSILEFANPGLLGPLETFRRDFAVPIERYGNEEAAERLRRIAGPFLLRRLKSDPTIIQDLPPKQEMQVICTLTREQATLYQAVVDEEMRRIESAEGIERRGRVLALLMFLKQICNHPAHYLGEAGPLPRRSGKLDRTAEMLEEALASGDKALVFTQFREMGNLLVAHLQQRLGIEVMFLHGGTPRRTRDEMVRRFQEDAHGPRIFVLSVKAGGTGLNLTAANHVFHFDRWWNPAVEDQATDRAYRIGQRRAVQVHKLVCAGTVEEKIDRMLADKRALASKVVGTGEKWITELRNDELRDLFALSADATVDGDE